MTVMRECRFQVGLQHLVLHGLVNYLPANQWLYYVEASLNLVLISYVTFVTKYRGFYPFKKNLI